MRYPQCKSNDVRTRNRYTFIYYIHNENEKIKKKTKKERKKLLVNVSKQWTKREMMTQCFKSSLSVIFFVGRFLPRPFRFVSIYILFFSFAALHYKIYSTSTTPFLLFIRLEFFSGWFSCHSCRCFPLRFFFSLLTSGWHLPKHFNFLSLQFREAKMGEGGEKTFRCCKKLKANDS